MAKSKQSFGKKEREKKRLKKQQEKIEKKQERKASSGGSDLDSMMAYIDENGNIVDTPPDPSKKKKIKASNIEIGVPKREKEDFSAERQGKVSYYDDTKGYGFIIDGETQEKYFVHVTGLKEAVTENDKVSFELERGLKGMNAVRVKRL